MQWSKTKTITFSLLLFFWYICFRVLLPELCTKSWCKAWLWRFLPAFKRFTAQRGTPDEIIKVKKKAYIKNRYNQVLTPAQDTIWENDKNTRKHHTQESQEVSPFQAGEHKAVKSRQDSIINKREP